MLKSMTGYGERTIQTALGGVRVELKSINHRFFDCKIGLPRELSFLEPEFREKIRKRVKRGLVFLNLYWEKSSLGLGTLKLNKDLSLSLKRNLKHLQQELKSSPPIPLALIANFPGVFYFAAPPVKQKKIKLAVHKVLNQALDTLVLSRTKEGKRIEKDIRMRLGFITKETTKIEQVLPGYRKRIKEKFEKKLKEIKMEEKIYRERLDKEIAFNLIRSDFTEEMVRIKSHLKSLTGLISKGTGGKKIDFFLQELNREINTLSDKASDINISKSAVRIKSELEKLREQSMNLE